MRLAKFKLPAVVARYAAARAEVRRVAIESLGGYCGLASAGATVAAGAAGALNTGTGGLRAGAGWCWCCSGASSNRNTFFSGASAVAGFSTAVFRSVFFSVLAVVLGTVLGRPSSGVVDSIFKMG